MADADIRPRGGGRLAYRLAASYFIILIFTFVILTGSFYFFLRASLHREAIKQLKRQGEALEKAYSSFEDKSGPLGDLKKREFFRLTGKLVVPE
ncbi:hypothetical protein [Thermoanaerobacterium sp. DL9XJH110]|uniref:hypothetical protein n=1 Tax=Thermoanaerobacterium sp. DL9XJH110 TaxID=3386643 RepID=UPI003BB50DF2